MDKPLNADATVTDIFTGRHLTDDEVGKAARRQYRGRRSLGAAAMGVGADRLDTGEAVIEDGEQRITDWFSRICGNGSLDQNTFGIARSLVGAHRRGQAWVDPTRIAVVADDVRNREAQQTLDDLRALKSFVQDNREHYDARGIGVFDGTLGQVTVSVLQAEVPLGLATQADVDHARSRLQ